jgi:endonuclease/exonuclease/phosphatase family metal-dependent hydrolase
MPRLKVMTFNVRQMDGDDGPQSWPFRKDALIETIQLAGPAILGTQETWDEQSAYVLDRFPDYRAFGTGRFGDTRDKHNKVFYDTGRLALLDTGDFWISETPDVPGSKAWDIPSPRMVTWGRMKLDGALEFVLLNTHFPYGRGADEARRQTARLVLEHIAKLPPSLPVVFTGDFNARPGGEVYNALTAVLHDAWTDAAHTSGPEGTVHGFGRFPAGARVDWILYRHCARVLDAETVTHTSGGLYPSDHYPVAATLDFAPLD